MMHSPRRILVRLAASLGLALCLQVNAHAQFAIPGFELVHTVPRETTLATPDLRDAALVWKEMFDSARHEIVFGQFYVAGQDGEALDDIMAHLAAAGRRGVKIRFLMEKKGEFASVPATIEKLKRIPNLEFRQLDYSSMTGNGIIHAKYFVVDGKTAYVGSQNFDWRSFSHIHETGLKITDATVAAQVQAIFEIDWAAQAAIAAGQPPTVLNHSVVPADVARGNYLVASPNAYNPPGVGDSQSELVRLIGQAQHEVRVQVLDYAPLSYGPNHTRPYYAVIDDALRAAAARGVKIKLMVSNWNTEAPAIRYLQSLAVLPNVEIRIVTLPQASTGFIPFARVIHTKAMSIDGQVAWIGTSNWSGGYLDNSRNLEVVLHDATMAQRVAALHEQTWSSSYAQPIDVLKVYPKPAKGKPAE
ncbi:phosphatidylserine/phosphatidylglycerophosphate/cardiolipin synthase-like enzyme [Herbaspirillum rubrisubalbicans]|uniref:phospholipase D-like domain-containing protein n=1 Tax=Herbaspirillum rubrisubalbicans TaxID=80842 RepID=UPI0020A2150D|nr:phospholipase D-like domain-containing protein [Herbaspirillum rubrisubalbicans]MCP1575641.1 phosphatidylserine/phosphatidylglycerophosphate/cardiolipin synthase-like enzyme [Herbaspirillum rubrisubalbicans]